MSKQREAFEAEHDVLDLRRHPEHDFYLDKFTQAYWEGAVWAWQASRAAALEEAAVKCDEQVEREAYGHAKHAVTMCADAIRALKGQS
ncbi:hypothetical protein [Cupriavidus necator]|uniref:hypothetical protein n=1 Tax=Cupriavidus necator TaxID=106590 RepID=UPI00339D437E